MNSGGTPRTRAAQQRPQFAFTSLKRDASLSKRSTIVGVSLLLGAATFLPSTASPRDDLPVRIAGAALMAASLLPGAIYLMRRDREAFPLVPLHALFYGVTFGGPAVLGEPIDNGPSLATAERLALLGVASLFVAYTVARSLLRTRIRPFRLRFECPDSRLVLAGWLFEGVYLASRVWPGFAGIPSLEQLLPALGWCGKGALFSLSFAGRMGRAANCILWLVILPVEIIDRLSSGALLQLVLLGLCIMALLTREFRRVPVELGLAGLLLVLAFQPVKRAYREEAWWGDLRDASAVEKAARFVELLAAAVTDPGKEAGAYAATAAQRLDHLSTLAVVAEMTPSTVPYWRGHTYEYFLYSWVPRAVWPEKPRTDLGNSWPRIYGLLHPNDFETSYNLPWLTEFYMNFGLAGVLVGMALTGVGLAVLTGKFLSGAMTRAEFVLVLPLALTLWYAESNLAAMWGGLVPVFLGLYGCLWAAAVLIPADRSSAARLAR